MSGGPSIIFGCLFISCCIYALLVGALTDWPVDLSRNGLYLLDKQKRERPQDYLEGKAP